jgi:hypothetical protein
VISLAAPSSSRSSRLARFLTGSVVALVTGGLLATGMTSVASAATGDDATLNVTVTNGTSVVEGYDVRAYEIVDGTTQWAYFSNNGITDETGKATIPGLEQGVEYAVHVVMPSYAPEGTSGTFAGGFLSGSTGVLLNDFDVTKPTVLTSATKNVTAALNQGATITGTISDPTDTPTIDAGYVSAYRYSPSIVGGGFEWELEGYGWTNSSEEPTSTYSLKDLRPGNYVLAYSQSLHPDWSSTSFGAGVANINDAETSAVTVAGSNTIDGRFTTGTSITGSVALAAGLEPQEYDVSVSAKILNADGSIDNSNSLYNSATVGVDGTFTISGVAAGHYAVEYSTEREDVYGEWYSNKATARTAETVTVGSAPVVLDNAELGTGFSLAGTVTSGGAPVEGVTVKAEPQNSYYEGGLSTTTDDAGHYSFPGLKPDDFLISFEYPDDTFDTYYYTADGAGTTDWAEGTLVAGVDGVVTADLDYPGVATMVLTVTDPAGKPVTSGSIEAVRVVNGARVYNDPWMPATKVAGKPGVYSLTLDTDTDYTILVDTYPATTAFAQFLGGVPAYGDDAIASAKTFNSGTGGSLAFQLAGPGKIAGKVTSTSKKALWGVAVTLFEYNGNEWVRSLGDTTSKTGTYSLPVRPGSYKVGFSTQGGPSNTFVGDYDYYATDIESLPTVYVGKGATATVNKSLALGGSITGTVANASGVATPRVYVTAVKLTEGVGSPSFGTTGYTSSKGAFTISGLPTGTYALSFDDNEEGRVGDTFQQGGTIATYTVTAGKVTKIASKIQLPAYETPRTATVSGSLSPAVPGVNGYVDFVSTDNLHYGRALLTGSGVFSVALIPGDYNYTVGFGESNAVEYRPLLGTLTVAAGQTTLGLEAIENNPLTFTTAPTIEADGTAVGASTLTAVADWDHDRARARYQWMRDGLPIFGATGPSYTPRGGDAGSSIAVRVTLDNRFYLGSEDYQTTVATTESVTITTGAALELMGSPVLVVTTQSPGGVIRVAENGWLPAGATASYAWYRDGDPIAEQTGSTYTILSTDIGASISAEVVATRVGRANSEAVATDSITVQNNPAPTLVKMPTVTATTKDVPAGSTKYTVTPGTWSVAGTTPSYTWYRDGDQLDVVGNTYTTASTTSAIWVTVAAAKATYDTSAHVAVLARKGTVPASALFTPFVQNSNTGDEISADTPVTVGTQLVATAVFTTPAGGVNPKTYVWQRLTGSTWAAISKATTSNYTVASADAGKALRVLITSSAPYYATSVSAAVAGVGTLKLGLVEERADGVSIAGTGAVTSTLSARIAPVENALPGVTNAYQWGTQVGEVFTPISKATKATFVVPASLLGKEIRVRVTATKDGYVTSVERSNGVIATTGTITIVDPTAISGTAKVAVKLTATPAVVDVTGTKRAYVWQMAEGEEWVAITGATGSTYTPTGSMTGRYVRVVETISKASHTTVSATSQVVGVDSGTLKLATAPKLTTTAAAYKVSAGASAPAAPAAYEWLVDGTPTGNHTSTYTRSTDDAGKMIGVVVTYELEGFSTLEAYVAAVKGIGTIDGGEGLISAHVGQPVVGGLLELNNPSGVTLRYQPVTAIQWLLDGKPIKGATDHEYVPVASQVGKKLTMSATYSSPEFDSGRYVSNPVTVEKGAGAENGVVLDSAPILVGSAVSGFEIAPQPGYTVSYQWYRSTGGAFVAIPKATKIAYTTVATDAGTELSLRVTYTRAGYESATYTVGSVSVLGSDGLAPITAPTLTGTGAAATELTATAGTWTIAPTLSYQWYRDDIAIPGATSAKYTPLGDHLGDTVYAKVTAKRAGFQTFVAQTNGVKITHGAPATATVAPKLTGASTTCSTLSVSSGSWVGDGLTFEYAWYRVLNGSKQVIAGANTNTYTTTSADLGYVITAVVGAQKTGHGTAGAGASTTALTQGCEF